MTNLERDFINHLRNKTRQPSATAAVFDTELGYVSSHAEADRLLKSEDYQKGWEACWDRMSEYLAELLAENSHQRTVNLWRILRR